MSLVRCIRNGKVFEYEDDNLLMTDWLLGKGFKYIGKQNDFETIIISKKEIKDINEKFPEFNFIRRY